jgi:succinylglutamate desuccinylase
MKTEESREKILDYFREHSNCEIPYCIQVMANREGAHVVIVGGTHGNEPAGVKAMVAFHRRLIKDGIKLHSGKVSLLMGNPQAYRKDRRYVDRDLNRIFGDPDDTTVEGRRALEIKNFFTENKDIRSLLDLHSVSIGDFKICVYKKQNVQSFKLAITISDIDLHFAYHPEHTPGTLIEAAGKHQICGIMVECGNHMSKQAVNTALEHIRAIVVYHNLMDAVLSSKKSMPATLIQYESIQSIRPAVNFRFLVEGVKTGTKLEKGQQFARDDTGYHVAAQECYIVVPSNLVKPTDTDAGFLCKMNRIDMNDL